MREAMQISTALLLPLMLSSCIEAHLNWECEESECPSRGSWVQARSELSECVRSNERNDATRESLSRDLAVTGELAHIDLRAVADARNGTGNADSGERFGRARADGEAGGIADEWDVEEFADSDSEGLHRCGEERVCSSCCI